MSHQADKKSLYKLLFILFCMMVFFGLKELLPNYPEYRSQIIGVAISLWVVIFISIVIFGSQSARHALRIFFGKKEEGKPTES